MTEQKRQTPSPYGLLIVYTILGTIVSFVFGRDPSSFSSLEMTPTFVQQELAPTIIIICGFLITYSVFDVLGVGIAKIETNYHLKGYYKDLPNKMPEAVYLAQRTQTNQVEQMTGFLFGSLSCCFWVNGKVSSILSLIWVISRRFYSSTYRNSVGTSFEKMGLSKFTLPAYLSLNTMVASVGIQALRVYLSEKE